VAEIRWLDETQQQAWRALLVIIERGDLVLAAHGADWRAKNATLTATGRPESV
jgi:hypothetical protein